MTNANTVTLHGAEVGGFVADGEHWPDGTVKQFGEHGTLNYEREGDVGIYIGESPAGQPMPPRNRS